MSALTCSIRRPRRALPAAGAVGAVRAGGGAAGDAEIQVALPAGVPAVAGGVGPIGANARGAFARVRADGAVDRELGPTG